MVNNTKQNGIDIPISISGITKSIANLKKLRKAVAKEVAGLNQIVSTKQLQIAQLIESRGGKKLTRGMKAQINTLKREIAELRKEAATVRLGVATRAKNVSPKQELSALQKLRAETEILYGVGMRKQVDATAARIKKFLGTNDLESYRMSLKRVKKDTVDLNKELKKQQIPFAGWAMSIMFLGMAMKNMFDTIWKSSSKTFNEVMHSVDGAVTGFDMLDGSMKYLGFAVGQALEPIAMGLYPIIDAVADWIVNNNELVGKVLLSIGIFGALFTVLGSLVLAVNGFREAFRLLGDDIVPVSSSWDNFIAKISNSELFKNAKKGIDDFIQNSLNMLKSALDNVDSSLGKIISKFGKEGDEAGLINKLKQAKKFSDQLKIAFKKLSSSFSDTQIAKALSNVNGYLDNVISKLKRLKAWQRMTGIDKGISAEQAASEIKKASTVIDQAIGKAGKLTKIEIEATEAATKVGDNVAGGFSKAFKQISLKELGDIFGPLGKILKPVAKFMKNIPLIGTFIEGTFEIFEGLTEDVSQGKSIWASIWDVVKDVSISGIIAAIIGAIVAFIVGGPVLAGAAAVAAVAAGITLIFSTISELIKQSRVPEVAKSVRSTVNEGDIDPNTPGTQVIYNNNTFNFPEGTSKDEMISEILRTIGASS